MTGELKLRGEEVRRKVLGDAHVDRSQRNATELTRDFQNLATEYCWGAIWTREALDLRTRSLINVAMLAALGRMDEFKIHVGGAMRNGATKEEIKEVLLQVAVYCGIPAGNEAFSAATHALDEFKEASHG